MNKIKSYYRLCGISNKEKELNLPVNMVSEKGTDVIFTKEQKSILFVSDGSELKLKESVIGGKNVKKLKAIKISGEDKSKMVIII